MGEKVLQQNAIRLLGSINDYVAAGAVRLLSVELWFGYWFQIKIAIPTPLPPSSISPVLIFWCSNARFQTRLRNSNAENRWWRLPVKSIIWTEEILGYLLSLICSTITTIPLCLFSFSPSNFLFYFIEFSMYSVKECLSNHVGIVP